MIDRCGCTSACSGVSSPPRTNSSTKLWSLVIWWSSPSRLRYARESPTCPIVRESSVPSMPAVSVVPMPCSSWFDSDFSRTASLAPSIASRSGSPDATAARNASSAVALATSPAWWPPIPSATATSPKRSI